MIAAFTCAGFHVGCAWIVSAAVPAMCGVAIEVPENVAAPLPLPMKLDTIASPGAEISGLSDASPMRGPPELNTDVPVLVGSPTATPVDVASRIARNEPSLPAVLAGPATPRNGIVTLNCSPVSGFDVIGPSNGGRPGALLISTTAAAPAFWP